MRRFATIQETPYYDQIMTVIRRDFQAELKDFNVLETYASEPYFRFIMANKQGSKISIGFLYDLIQDKI